jgi:esterase
VKLFSKVIGQGQPLLIIHGLFGMSDNWQSLAKQFAAFFEVHLIDLPNHGRSYHTDEFSYSQMSEDIKAYISDSNLENVIIIGHSLGGKLAMQLAVTEPQLISKLIVVDISPRFYPIHHDKIIEGLQSLDFSALKSRSEAEAVLSRYIEENDVRQFLLKSMYWKEKGVLDFRFNLGAISANIANVGEALIEGALFEKPTLFLKGENSNYINDDDEDLIFTHFPNADIENIENSGHWLHAENPTQFFETVIRFCI